MLFQELRFYNVLIENPQVKRLKKIALLHKLPFCDKLSIAKISKTFKKCAKNYKVGIIDSKDPLAQLEASKSSAKNSFKDLLNEVKGFKYHVAVKVLLSKRKKKKKNGDIELTLVYFNFTTKRVINLEHDLDKSFQKIFIRD